MRDIRRRLPIPRYTLRKIGFLFGLGILTIASAQGSSNIAAQMKEQVAQLAEKGPEPALARMVSSGAIRPARQRDLDAWIRVADLTEEERHNLSLYSDMTYVVLRPVRLPGEMYGAHSREFIIPVGVPFPENGRPSHNGFYFMENGTCIGGSSACSL